MTDLENKISSLLGTMPNYIFDYLEISDDIKEEWKHGLNASDFGGHRSFVIKYTNLIMKEIEKSSKSKSVH